MKELREGRSVNLTLVSPAFRSYKWHYKNDRTNKKHVNYGRSLNRKYQGLKDNLTLQSYVGLLNLPENLRPSNLEECIDLFYPLAGIGSVDEKASLDGETVLLSKPFQSTYLEDYDPNPEDPKNYFLDDVPFDFGEVSMMYGWFLIYRMLLCPGTMGSLITALGRTDPFKKVAQRDIEIAEESASRLKQDYSEKFETVALVKTLASIASKVTGAMSSGKLGDLSLSDLSPEKVLEQIKDLSAKDLMDYATQAYGIVESRAYKDFGLDDLLERVDRTLPDSNLKTPVRDNLGDFISAVSQYSVAGFIETDLFEKLESCVGDFCDIQGLSDELSNVKSKTFDKLKEVAKVKLTEYGLPMEDVEKLSSDFELTKPQDFLISATARRISPKARTYVREQLAKEACKLQIHNYLPKSAKKGSSVIAELESASKKAKARKNPSLGNPALVASSVIDAVNLGCDLYQSFLSYQMQQDQKNIDREKTNFVYGINEQFQYKTYRFWLDSRTAGGSQGNSKNATFARSCANTQNGMLLSYFLFAWKKFTPKIQEIEGLFSGLGDYRTALEEINNPDRVNYYKSFFDTLGRTEFSDSDILPTERELYDFDCHTMRKFQYDIFKSTKIAIDNLDKISPFSFYMSLEPSVYQNKSAKSTPYKKSSFLYHRSFAHPSVKNVLRSDKGIIDDDYWYAPSFRKTGFLEGKKIPYTRLLEVPLSSNAILIDGGAPNYYDFMTGAKTGSGASYKYPQLSWGGHTKDRRRGIDSLNPNAKGYEPHNNLLNQVGGSFAVIPSSNIIDTSGDVDTSNLNSELFHDDFARTRDSVVRMKSLDELKESLHDYDSEFNSKGADFQLIYERALGTPVFRGQFAGLISVLLCYPEAIVTLKQAGVAWAKDIEMFDFDEIELPDERSSDVLRARERRLKQKEKAELIKRIGTSANASYAVFQASRVSDTYSNWLNELRKNSASDTMFYMSRSSFFKSSRSNISVVRKATTALITSAFVGTSAYLLYKALKNRK